MLRCLPIHFWDFHIMISHSGNHFGTLALSKLQSRLPTKCSAPPSCALMSSLFWASRNRTCPPDSIKMHSAFWSASLLFCVWSLAAQGRRIWYHLFWRANPGTSNVSIPIRLLVSFIILYMQYMQWYESLLLIPPMALTDRTPHFCAIVSSQMLLSFWQRFRRVNQHNLIGFYEWWLTDFSSNYDTNVFVPQEEAPSSINHSNSRTSSWVPADTLSKASHAALPTVGGHMREVRHRIKAQINTY